MPDPDNHDYQVAVEDLVEDAEVPLSEPILFLTAEFLTPGWAWVGAEFLYPRNEAPAILQRDGFELLPCRPFDPDLIACHAASSRGSDPRRKG